MEQIAGLMPVVTKLCHTKVHLKYTWKDIYNLLRIIFSTRRIEGSSGEEDDFYLQVVRLRRQFPKSCVWASMTEEQAITKVEEIVTQDNVPASNDSGGWAKLIKQIEAILRQYTFLGEHSESMGTLQNILGWLPFCMDPPASDRQQHGLYCRYQKGQLQLLIDLEKQRIGYNKTHIRNDITRVSADAIVNTANPEPVYGGGTDAALYKVAGEKDLLIERKKLGDISVGGVAVTPAFHLPAKYIIHTVGPIWEDGCHGEFDQLASSLPLKLKESFRQGPGGSKQDM